jgi:hypothetical protein
MTHFKLLSAALIATAMLAAPAIAREDHSTSRHIARNAEAAGPGTVYVDGRPCYPAPRVGAFASQPWTNSGNVPCMPSPDYYDYYYDY